MSTLALKTSIKILLMLCVAVVVGGCKPKMREGEVFVLLKSDEIKPLADIEVTGLAANFGSSFSDWQRKWNNELSQPVNTLIKKNPKWSARFEQIDRQIAETLSKTNSLETEARNNLANRLRELQSEQSSLSNRLAGMREQLAKTKMLYDELSSIQKPFEDKLATFEARSADLKRKLRTIEENTYAKINELIMSEKLQIKRLDSSEYLFSTDIFSWANSPTQRLFDRQERYFLVESVKDPKSTIVDSYSNTFLTSVPRELESSVECSRLLKSSFGEWKRLKAELDSIEGYTNDSYEKVPGGIADTKEQLHRALIPFENKAGTEVAESYAAAVRALEDTEARSKSIQREVDSLRAGSLNDEISRLRRNILSQAQSLESSKGELVAEAEKEIRAESLAECISAFASLVSSNAVYSTRTGSKGDFQLPANVAFVFAGAIRPNTGETPCWLVKVDPQQKSIRLSNSNLATKENPDSTWMLKHTP